MLASVAAMAIIIFEGVDRAGKTSVALELSRKTGIPYFKGAPLQPITRKDFCELVFRDYATITHMLEVLNCDIIIDRFLGSEYAYSFLRSNTNTKLLFELDKKLASLDATNVLCLCNEYDLMKRWKNTSETGYNFEMNNKLNDRFHEFVELSKCNALVLDTALPINFNVNELLKQLNLKNKFNGCTNYGK